MSSRLPASQSASAPSNSSIASSVPHAELAAVIASVVDERINRQLIQDGGTSNVGNAQLAGPSPPSNLQDSLRSSPPPQDGGQQQRPVNNNLPFKILQQVISQTPPFLLVSLLLLVLVPSHLLLTFLIQPKSHHFTRTSDSLPSPAIWLKPPRRPSRTVSTWTLLPLLAMTSLLNDTIHSHLNLKVDNQGLTLHLPSSSKDPKITSIDRWLDAFAIYFAVIVSVYPSCAADWIAYQQLIRDAAQKFPGIAWYV